MANAHPLHYENLGIDPIVTYSSIIFKLKSMYLQ